MRKCPHVFYLFFDFDLDEATVAGKGSRGRTIILGEHIDAAPLINTLIVRADTRRPHPGSRLLA